MEEACQVEVELSSRLKVVQPEPMLKEEEKLEPLALEQDLVEHVLQEGESEEVVHSSSGLFVNTANNNNDSQKKLQFFLI